MIKANVAEALRSVFLLVFALGCVALTFGCKRSEERLEPRSLTWAELRTVRNPVRVTPPGEGERSTYLKERLADGAKVRLEAGALAWLRRDGGATFLVRGPARLTLRARSVFVEEGRLFVDTPPGANSELATAAGMSSVAGTLPSTPSTGQPSSHVTGTR